MKVWIEQAYCTGEALCEELCPAMFVLQDDGLAHVKDPVTGSPADPSERVEVPAEQEEAVFEAQAQCAGECIYVER